ncbi:MAG: S1 RNA-binding domain-containing protein [Prevotella sp.]
MLPQVKIGDFNRLKVKELARREGYGPIFGVYLEGGREGDILMPQKYVPEGIKPGDEIDCFVYLDQEERLVATTEKPLAKVGDFAWLKCSWVNEYGAFLDWGITKNLFCPFREQKKRMEVGNSYIVHIHVDEESYRLMASAKVERYLSHDTPSYKTNDEVDLLIWQKTDLGFKVIVDNKFGGLVYQDQIFQYIHSGDRLKGYVAQVRADGKLDITLQPTGRRETEDFAQTLLQWLKDNGGECHLGYKSDAEDIKRMFQVSKKTFKRAVGALYKQHLIVLEGNGFRLTTED